MIRIITLAALTTLAVPAFAQTATPVLKRSVVVKTDIVRIGDFIDNAGPAADIAIFRSPDLGDTGAIATTKVMDAIRARAPLEIDTRDIGEVKVTRASHAIPSKEIRDAVLQAIGDQHGIDGKTLSITYDNEPRTLHVEPDAAGPLKVRRIVHDLRGGRFDITFELPGGNALRSSTLRLTGMAVETTELPVLARAIGRGEIINDSDLAMERRPKSDAGGDVAIANSEIVGKAARRAMRPGQSLHQADLMRPELVQRNEAVTIVYQTPGMTLTVRGKAMAGGAEGDVIDVTNTQSKRTIQAKVIGPGRVSIATVLLRTSTAKVASNNRAGPALASAE